MAENTPSATADPNRPLSGPPVPLVVEAHDVNGAPFSMEAARAALLQLKESVTSADFDRFISGMMDASTTTEQDIAKEAEMSEVNVETSTTDDDEEMDASSSSSDGSTVRDINNQLLAGEGNTGSVSVQGVASGNAHPGTSDGEWCKVKRKRSAGSKASDSSVTGKGNHVKKGRIDTGLFVYLKGSDFDIGKEASRQPLDFCRKLSSLVGAVTEVKVIRDSVRVTCVAPKQKMLLLQITDWFGKLVTVTEPWGKAPAGNRMPDSIKGIIFGVSTELSESDIASETEAQSVRRVTRWLNRDQIKTGSVILTYEGALPDYVSIGFIRYRVKPYVPQPMRCNRCQRFGHIAANCKRQSRCVRCGQSHNLDSCPIKDDVTKAVCVNCNGQHSAAFRGCSKYQEVSKVLKVSVAQKLSYRDALVKVKSDVLQHRIGGVAGPRPLQTSTPLPATAPPPAWRPAPVQPSSRRELFHTSAEACRVDQGEPSAEARQVNHGATTSEAHRAEQNGASAAEQATVDHDKITYTLRDYLKQLTHHILYVLAILEGHKPVCDFVTLRSSLTKIATQAFGEHGSSPCLTPNCCK